MDRTERKLTAIWLLLIGITFVSWEFVAGTRTLHPVLPILLLLALAFVKVRFVILDFMEIRGAPLALRAVLEVWMLVACLAIVGVLWFKP